MVDWRPSKEGFPFQNGDIRPLNRETLSGGTNGLNDIAGMRDKNQRTERSTDDEVNALRKRGLSEYRHEDNNGKKQRTNEVEAGIRAPSVNGWNSTNYTQSVPPQPSQVAGSAVNGNSRPPPQSGHSTESDVEEASYILDAQFDRSKVLNCAAHFKLHLGRGVNVQKAVRALLIEKLNEAQIRWGSDKAQIAKLTGYICNILKQNPGLKRNAEQLGRLCSALLILAEQDLCYPYLMPRALISIEYSSMDDVSSLVASANNIVVLSGAGVSVSCGIPDFRSAGGLYEKVAERYGFGDPQVIFDLQEFQYNPSLFYSFAQEIMPDKELLPSLTHEFIAELDRRGKLLRNYTQNIDGLESRTSVRKEKVILCHGSFSTATCVRKECRERVDGTTVIEKVKSGQLPQCAHCNPKGAIPYELDEEVDDAGSSGILKPDIIFFGEALPQTVYDSMMRDRMKCDLVLVLGTSLKVAPVSRFPREFPSHVPRVLVNREALNIPFNVELLGDCDHVVKDISRRLGWDLKQSGVLVPDGSANGSSEAKIRFVPPGRFVYGEDNGSRGRESQRRTLPRM